MLASRCLGRLGALVVQQTTTAATSSSVGPIVAMGVQRWFSSTAQRNGEKVHITFVDEDGDRHPVEANEGETVLDVAHANDVDLEGACEGTLACSTCHVVVDKEHFPLIPDPEEEELDMLDLAIGLEDTSRLGCQIKLTKQLDGMVCKIPSMTADVRRKIE
eukprot:comp20989_c0_seq1/m.28130 comp20989_c0_seq1/g.28130  ORF comp20989_c0_seq1/g.28130 comp20989_c0_seq1/m.28130 type:complete len:161 (-) comp20989_c0_seq1:105-587(-)